MELWKSLPVSLLLLGVFIMLVLLYLYITNDRDYWSSKGVVSIKPYPIIGSNLSLMTGIMHDEEFKRYKKYGKVYGAFEGRTPVLSIADPDLLKEIFVKDFHVFADRRSAKVGDPIVDNMLFLAEGEQWKRIRTLISPVFSSGKLRKMAKGIEDCVSTLVENFSKAARENTSVDCRSLYGAFSMDVICSSAFGTKIDSHNDPNNAMVVNVQKIFTQHLDWRVLLFMTFPWIAKLFKIELLDPSVTGFFKRVALQLIQERNVSVKKRDDLLQLLMDAEKTNATDEDPEKVDEDFSFEEGSTNVFQPNKYNKSMSHDEIIAQCFQFFFAGYDTTSTTLTFATYLLALNPECQERLIKEIDDVFSENGQIDYEVVRDMKYLECVIYETLRMYTPVIKVERVATEEYNLGDTGIVIPKGTLITIPVTAIHRDPEYFPNPDTFDPERFVPEQKEARHPFTFLPFGSGPRYCMGMRFALMEAKLCLTHIFRRFRFKVCAETKIPPEFISGQALLHPKAVKLDVQERTDVAK